MKFGVIGGEMKYTFFNDTVKGWAAAARASYMQLFGATDFTFATSAVDVMASKTLGKFTPYAGITGTLNHAKEITESVNLNNENVLDGRLIAGMEFRTKVLNLGAEVSVSQLVTYGFKLGVTF